jgi:branched-chain amino acid transport system permease protein
VRPTVRTYLWRAVRIGLLAGVFVMYLAAIGMLERFDPRNIVTGVITLGLVTEIIVILVASYRAGRPAKPGERPQERLVSIAAGALTGATAGVVFGLFVIFIDAVPVRAVFANISPALIQIVTLGQTAPVAAAIYTVGWAIVGAIGASLVLLTPRIRRPLVAALLGVLLISLMEPMLRVVLLQLGLPQLASFFYQARGLTIPGAIVVFLVVVAVAFLRDTQRERIAERYRVLPPRPRLGVRVAAFALMMLVLLALPLLIGSFLSEVVGTVGLFILMGLGLNIVVGYAGLLDLGYVAFFAVGAYVVALLTSPLSVLALELNFWLVLPIVMVVAAMFGILIGAPVLRLRGDYLAIVTLGFGEIVRILLLSPALQPWFGGAQGILSIPPPGLGISRDPQSLYYPILFFCLLGAFVAWSLANSRIGRAWNAMREDEEVAQATGVSTTNYKLLAFGIGAVFGCLAGAFLAVKLGSVFPHRLDILVSITTLSLIILGGMGSIPGVVVGAFVLVGLPELLREFAEYRLLIYGAVLVSMMILRPEGLIPNRARRRELHQDEGPPEAQFGRRASTGTDGAPVIAGG